MSSSPLDLRKRYQISAMPLVACPSQRRVASGCVDSCGNAGNADATAYNSTARWHAERSSAMIAVPAHASWRGEAAASGVQLRQQLLLTRSSGLPRHPPHCFRRHPPFPTLTRHTVVGYRRAALSLPCSANHCKLGQQLRYGFGVPYCKKVGCSERAPVPYNTKHKAEAGIQAACSPQTDAIVTE